MEEKAGGVRRLQQAEAALSLLRREKAQLERLLEEEVEHQATILPKGRSPSMGRETKRRQMPHQREGIAAGAL